MNYLPLRIVFSLLVLLLCGLGWLPGAMAIQTLDVRGDSGAGASLAVDANHRPHIAYYATQGCCDTELKYARWDGVLWHFEPVDATVTRDNGAVASLALDSQGNPHIAYDSGTRLKYARWNGTAWEFDDTIDTLGAGRYASLALDSTNTPHISYEGIRSSDQTKILKYATRVGGSWQVEELGTGMTADSELDAPTGLALDAANRPQITTRRKQLHGSPLLDHVAEYAQKEAAGQWIERYLGTNYVPVPGAHEPDPRVEGPCSKPVFDAQGTPFVACRKTGQLRLYQVSSNTIDPIVWPYQLVAGVDEVNSVALGVEPSGTVHVVYSVPGSDPSVDNLIYTTNEAGGWHPPVFLDQTAQARGLSLVMDNGAFHVSYYDANRGDLRYAGGPAGWQTQKIETDPGVAGDNPSLAMAGDVPYVSYDRLADLSKLPGLVVSNWDGTTWNRTRVYPPPGDNTTTVGSPTNSSLSINNQGLPGVSFYMAPLCGGMECPVRGLVFASSTGGGWNIEPVDSDGDVGIWSTLMFDALDEPTIVYADSTHQRVKIAQRTGGAWQVQAGPFGPVMPLSSSGQPGAARLPNGEIALSYFDADPVASGIHVVRWDGVHWSDDRVDGPLAGSLNAVAVDPGTLQPLVAYNDDSGAGFRYAISSGSGQWQIYSPPAWASTGNPSGLSLALPMSYGEYPYLAWNDGGVPQVAPALRATQISGGGLPTIDDACFSSVGRVSLAADNRVHIVHGDCYSSSTDTLPLPPAPAQVAGANGNANNPVAPCPTPAPTAAVPLAHGAALSTGPLQERAIFEGLDSVFRTTEGGRQYINLYNQHATEMGRLALEDPRLLWDAYLTLQNFLPGFEALVTGRGQEVRFTAAMIAQAYDIWTRLAAVASPGLKAAITQQLAAYNNLQRFVGMTFSQGAQTIGVSPPGAQETPAATLTPSATPTRSAPSASTSPSSITPTPTAPPSPCVGDCGGNGEVTVDELLLMVNIALGSTQPSQCIAGDKNQDGGITVDEILTAVNNALTGCPR